MNWNELPVTGMWNTLKSRLTGYCRFIKQPVLYDVKSVIPATINITFEVYNFNEATGL